MSNPTPSKLSDSSKSNEQGKREEGKTGQNQNQKSAPGSNQDKK